MENLKHIIKASVKGDQKSQRSLYEAYRTRWYMLSLRYAKDKPQADDIFQEGMIQVFKDLHQFDANKSNFSTWSSRVIMNAALRYLKKHTWKDSFTDLATVANYEDENESIFQKIAAKELTKMIQQLPLGYRIVFNMFAIEGFSHSEIAEELGITVGTSKSQLSKARRALKEVLESQLTKSSHE